MDVVKEDMKLIGLRKEDAEDRLKWRQIIHCENNVTLRNDLIFPY